MRFCVTPALVVLFWVIAATPFVALHVRSQSMPPDAAACIKVGAIIVAAFCYTRWGARACTVDQALLVGITWLLLDIGADLAATRYLGSNVEFIGDTTTPILRDIVLITWIVAPALFARHPAAS